MSAKGMPGATAPLGYFDPLGIQTDNSILVFAMKMITYMYMDIFMCIYRYMYASVYVHIIC